MSNLTVENLAGMFKSGDIESVRGGVGAEAPASEARVSQVMREQGMTPPQNASSTDANPHGFSSVLQDSINKVNEYQADADHAIKELVAGKNKNIHETMLTLERADSSLKLMMAVRNKVLEAYKEIMRMQV